VVVSVGYRLAPKSKFPTAVNDAYDALLWCYHNAKKFNGDPSNISVAGESAGGNLAAAVSILARDNEGPHIQRMVMLYPWIDGTLTRPSITKYDLFLQQDVLLWFRNNYVRTYQDVYNPLFSLHLTTNLSYLPKSLIITAERDPLVDDGYGFYEQLKEAGNIIRYSLYRNVPHGFYSMDLYWREGSSRKANSEMCDFLIS